MPESGLAPGDVLGLSFLRAAQLAPDGKRVAYAVSRTDESSERFEIHVLDLAGDERRPLPFEGNAMWPCWSPNGEWLAFQGDGRLYIGSTASLEITGPLTPEGLSMSGPPTWSPLSDRLAVSLSQHRRSSGPRSITKRHYRAERIGYIDDLAQEIHIVSLAGSLRRLTGPEHGLCSQPEWSPCGKRILFFATDDAVPGSSYSPRLACIDVESLDTRVLLNDPWYVGAARWLPSGERIVVAATTDATITIPNPRVWVIGLDGTQDLRTPELEAKVGGLLHHDMPSWELSQANALTVLDERTLILTVLARGAMEIWEVALQGDSRSERIHSGERSVIALGASKATDTLLYAATTLHDPFDLWQSTLDGRNEVRITALNERILQAWPRMRIQHLAFKSPDGLPLEAWFMARADTAAPMPIVLFIHGGPFASTGHAFRYDFHLLASHGFGVLFANFRGSAGYGDSFSRAIMGDWGGRGFPDHMATVDAAIERGLADPDRLGVWGPSHGGFATSWIVGHTSRFKAAISEAGVTNLVTAYYTTDCPETRRRDLGGRPHEIPDVYRTCSPLTYASRCTTPTMLIHGEDDLRVPVTEAEQFYRALSDVGCETELVRIPQCHHMGDSCGPPSARVAQNEALLRWFRDHL